MRFLSMLVGSLTCCVGQQELGVADNCSLVGIGACVSQQVVRTQLLAEERGGV